MKAIDIYFEAIKDLTTVLDFLRFGISASTKYNLYYGHGTENAYDDFYYLIFDLLNLPIDEGKLFFNAALTQAEKKLLMQKIYLRIEKKIPVPYLTNKAHLFGLDFFVDERVLIPRSPIGELIQNHFSPWVDYNKVQNILEIGTGSACLAITACLAFPEALVDAVDISKEALEVAEINKLKYSLEGQLELIESDCFASLPLKKYDIIFSNPPYVSLDEMQNLPLEYKAEPVLALEALEDGLLVVNNILKNASNYLIDGGILVVEVGNTAQSLVAKYPKVPFLWLDCESGGDGVFLLTKEQLEEYL